MDLKTSTGFIIFIYMITAATTQGPDPWDEIDIGGPVKFDNHKTEKKTNSKCEPDTACVGDLFYRRLLAMIIARGHFKENVNGLHEGSLHFILSKSDFLMLNKLSTLAVSLTPVEMRTMDGILSHGIIESHYLQIMANDLLEILWMWMMMYYLHGIFLIALVMCIYNLRKVNWAIVFTVRAIVILIIIVSIAWEYYEVYQEANIEIFKKLNDETQESSIFSYFIKKREINIPQAWKYLHPMNILTRLTSKLIFIPLKELMNFFDSITLNITGNISWPYSTIMYTGLTVIYYSLVIMLLTSFTLYFIFGKIPTSLSLYGLKINFTNKNRNQNDDNNPEMQIQAPDYSDNDNLKASLNLCNNLVDLLRSKDNSTKNLEEINNSDGIKSDNNKFTSATDSKSKCDNSSSESESKSNHVSQPANVASESDYEENSSSDDNIVVISKIRKRPIPSKSNKNIRDEI